MTTFKISIHINKPPEIIVKALMRPENAVYWTSDLEKFEVVKGRPGEVGAIAHLHYNEKGRSYIMEDVLEYSEPGRKYVSRVSGGGMNIRVETTINTIIDGTEMTMTWSGKSDKLFMRVLLPFLRKVMIRRAKVDLDKFKTLVETYGADFPKEKEEPLG